MLNGAATYIPTAERRDSFTDNGKMSDEYWEFCNTLKKVVRRGPQGANMRSPQVPSKGDTQGQRKAYGRGSWGKPGQDKSQGAPRKGHNEVPRQVKRAPGQLQDEEQQVHDLLQQLEQKNFEIKRLREELQRRRNSVDEEATGNAFLKQIKLNETLQDKLKIMKSRLDESGKANATLRMEKTWQQQTIESLQNRLECKNEAQAVDETGEEDDLCTLQSKLKEQVNKNASLEKFTTALQATITDREELCMDMQRRLHETRQDLQKKSDQLEIEMKDKDTRREDMAAVETKLYKMQARNHELDRTNKSLKKRVENLEKEVRTQQQTITDLRKQDFKLKTEIQAQMDKNDNLEERLKLSNRTFEKKEGQLEVTLHKTQAQLNEVKGKHEAYVAEMGKRLADANKTIEKERDCLQKERQSKTELVEQLRREIAEKEATSSRLMEADKDRDSENALINELEEQKVAVRDLRGRLKAERCTFKETVSRCSERFQAVIRERDELRRTVEDQQQTVERQKKQVKELSQALTAAEDTKTELQQEKEDLQNALRNSETHMKGINDEPDPTQEKKKRKLRWKFWRRN